jgi:RNAse (barnase) inhibitor barstar
VIRVGAKMKTIVIDWTEIRSEQHFYAAVLPQTDAPSWHGHNLDAINDSWVTGGVCPCGPPFNYVFRQSEAISPDLKTFAEAVSELAHDSVAENGGWVTNEK